MMKQALTVAAILVYSTVGQSQETFHKSLFRINPEKNDVAMKTLGIFQSNDHFVASGPAVIDMVSRKFVDGEWVNSRNRVFGFNENGYNMSSVSSDWMLETWLSNRVSICERDELGRVVKAYVQEHSYEVSDEDNAPNRKYRIDYSYDGDLVTEMEVHEWNNTGNFWQRAINTRFQYNEQGKVERRVSRYINHAAAMTEAIRERCLSMATTNGLGTSEEAVKAVFSYACDSIINFHYTYKPGRVEICKRIKSPFKTSANIREGIVAEYNENGKIIVVRRKKAEGAEELQLVEQELYQYDGDVATLTNQRMVDDGWENYKRLTTTVSGGDSELLIEDWDGGVWENAKKVNYVYGSEVYPDLVQFFRWGESTGSWVQTEEETYQAR